MAVDNTNRGYDWGGMESTVWAVKLVTFRDLSKPKRVVRKRRVVKKKARRRRGSQG